MIFIASFDAYAVSDLYCNTVDECLCMLPSFKEESPLEIDEKQKIEGIFSKAIKIEKNNPLIYQKRAEYYFKINEKNKLNSDLSLALSLYKSEQSLLEKRLDEAQDSQIKAIIYSKLSRLYEAQGNTYRIISNLENLQTALAYFELTVNSYEHVLSLCKEESTQVCNLSNKMLPGLIARREELNNLVRDMIGYIETDMKMGDQKYEPD